MGWEEQALDLTTVGMGTVRMLLLNLQDKQDISSTFHSVLCIHVCMYSLCHPRMSSPPLWNLEQNAMVALFSGKSLENVLEE